MQWKLLGFSLALSLLWTWLLDTFLFASDNLFWWIFFVLVVVVPLISFIYKALNLMLVQIFMKRLIDDQLHQGWIDSKLPLIHPSMAEDYGVLEYLEAITRWPDATKEQSNTASAVLGNFEGVKTNGLLAGFYQLRTLNRAYKRYMRDFRHIWEDDKTFAGYMVDPDENPENLILDKSMQERFG
jgi:hypothetical protein